MTRQERKVVTIVFVDLVGFTSRAEELDPEDVVAVLRPYHERLRSELERFGGTVEKFIGDAVMAVFGAPVAHEDDPERAVRAGLAIRDWAREERDLQVRIAVNTGEALVDLDARAELGESLVGGDVVNTTSRLQSAAPVNGILVGEQTYRATRDAIDYRELEPVEAKGKAHAVPVWEALDARARFGVDVEQRSRVELVGRSRELDLLVDAFARARSEREPQLVTLVGAPGIGKSRLVYEFFQRGVEQDPELIYWRQGRCLPYGEGVTYWAVGEMVKAQAGILDTDSAEEAAAKLAEAAAAAGEDARWVEGHLRPLVGLVDASDPAEDRQVEAYAAWRRFFEALAEQRPLVLVFEDLHWADSGLFDFVDHLVEWATGVPLLVLCTARPELLERRPGWGGGKLNATTVALSPLSETDSARLIAELIGQAVLPAETQSALLARAGGNPLYAEQYARMFAERGSAEDLPLPENVQGIIAARLDGLSPEEKAVLQDAAVVGKVFWPGVLQAIGGGAPEQILHSLERKEFVRRERRSSVGRETEHAFRHMLVRDVAYGQIPRADRAEKHSRAAEWIEALSERTEDVAEMLAHHYASALEFARASGQDTDQLAERARHALRRAGERALTLSAFPGAVRFLTAALELWPRNDFERPELQLDLARAQHWTGELYDGILVEARDALLEQGRLDLAARAETRLGFFWWNRGRNDLAQEHVRAAASLVEQAPLSLAKAWASHDICVRMYVAGELEESVSRAAAAAEMAEQLGVDDLRAEALITLGSARFALGESDGLAEIERGLALGEEINSGEIAIRACKNLGDALQRTGDLERAAELHARGLDTARRLGDVFHVRWFTGEQAYERYLEGRWGEALAQAGEVIAGVEAGSPHYMEAVCRQVRALIGLARGDAVASADSERMLELGRSIGDPQVLWPALAVRARVLAAGGDLRGAGKLLDEVEAQQYKGVPGPGTADFAFAATAAGRTPGFFQAARKVISTPWVEAGEAICLGDFVHAAEVYGAMGSRPDEADARLLAARALVDAGRRTEAEEHLRRALAFFREVGATAYLREGEKLLAASA